MPTESIQKPSTLGSIIHQRCPRCRVGAIFRSSIFRGWPRMLERCPVCDLKYEREPGYFLGAMYISYGIALVTITLLALLFWGTMGWPILKSTVWGFLAFLPLVLPITLFSRVLCIYLDQAIDPERTK
jgi:uncharacterized protein (DUF983 family)